MPACSEKPPTLPEVLGDAGQRLQRGHAAPSVRTGGDAIRHRAHAQAVHAFVVAGSFRQEGDVFVTFQIATSRQVAAHPARDAALIVCIAEPRLLD